MLTQLRTLCVPVFLLRRIVAEAYTQVRTCSWHLGGMQWFGLRSSRL
jgi:hypothetical protein